MNPIIVKNELPGYLSDRLQEALWREGLHIINEGYATTKDLDRAIEDGPGLRWSLMGTFFNLSFGWRKLWNEPYVRTIWTCFKTPVDEIKST
jgi:carnitine 3-dehydrogenase